MFIRDNTNNEWVSVGEFSGLFGFCNMIEIIKYAGHPDDLCDYKVKVEELLEECNFSSDFLSFLLGNKEFSLDYLFQFLHIPEVEMAIDDWLSKDDGRLDDIRIDISKNSIQRVFERCGIDRLEVVECLFPPYACELDNKLCSYMNVSIDNLFDKITKLPHDRFYNAIYQIIQYELTRSRSFGAVMPHWHKI
jgi:hypothetical protein